MSNVVRVDPEALHMSAHLTEGHAEDVHIGHSSADARIVSALPAWVGVSSTAMAAKAAEWQAVTGAFSSRLIDHAEALRVSGIAFQQTDDNNAADISAVASAVEQSDLGRL